MLLTVPRSFFFFYVFNWLYALARSIFLVFFKTRKNPHLFVFVMTGYLNDTTVNERAKTDNNRLCSIDNSGTLVSIYWAVREVGWSSFHLRFSFVCAVCSIALNIYMGLQWTTLIDTFSTKQKLYNDCREEKRTCTQGQRTNERSEFTHALDDSIISSTSIRFHRYRKRLFLYSS